MDKLFPPPINHLEHFYGFVGVALAWQLAFLAIAREPLRLRPVMIAAAAEKLLFSGSSLVLIVLGQVPAILAIVALVSEPMVATDLEHLGVYEALHQTEHIGIGAALQLTETLGLLGVEKPQSVDQRQSIGEKFVIEIETAPPNNVLLYIPANSLGHFDAFGVSGRAFEWAA